MKHTVQVVQRLTSIINFWGERKVFSPETAAAFMSAVALPGSAPSLAPPAPSPAAAPQVGTTCYIACLHLELVSHCAPEATK